MVEGEWPEFKPNWQMEKIFLKRAVKDEEELVTLGIYPFGKYQAGAAICINLVDRDFCYISGGLDQNRMVSNRFIQVKYNQNLNETTNSNFARMLDDLPEPRFQHSAICVRGMVIITGGLSSLQKDMEMFMQVPCS